MIPGIIIGLTIGTLFGIWLNDKYEDRSVKTIIVVPDKKHEKEVPVLLEAIDKIKTNEILN